MKNGEKIKKRFAGRSYLFALFFIMFLVATFKYVSHGEAYTFEVPSGDSIAVSLNENIISQEIIIDEMASWGKTSYAVWLIVESYDKNNFTPEGYLRVELTQNEQLVDEAKIPAAWLSNGFCYLKWLHYSKLEAGTAKITIWGEGLNFSVSTAMANEKYAIYNLPNCYINGEMGGYPLVQYYHYTYSNMEHKIGLYLFALLIVICAISYVICDTKNERYSKYLHLNLILTYMILVFEYDSSLYMNPTWAEAITNFMHNSVFDSIKGCFLVTDAGYMPLCQRLIAIFIFDILRLPAHIGVYAIQIIAYILSGFVLSFFIRKQFASVANQKIRYIFSILIMIFVISKETGAFINFITYGVFITFLYFVADSKDWTKIEFSLLCIWGFVTCLSKGVYVVLFPFMILSMILFHKGFSKRDYIFSTVTAMGALLQLIYYLAHGIEAIDWVDRYNYSSMENYYLKLFMELFIDTPNRILGVFVDKISIFNGISIIVICLFWVVFIYFFVKEVIAKCVRKEIIAKYYQLIFMMLIYIMGQSLFLRITVYGVNRNDILTDYFWTFVDYGISERREVLIFLAVCNLCIVMMSEIRKKKGDAFLTKCMVGLVAAVCIINPRLQLKGVGNDGYSQPSKNADMVAESILLNGIKETECRVVPIQPNHWVYKKNAALYCFGSNLYSWSTTAVITSEEPQMGQINMSNYSNVNKEIPIWQVFITKNCLVNNSQYQITLLDTNGSEILTQKQDNSIYQKMTSFTFYKGIENVETIMIKDDSGNQVHLENVLYVVTCEDDQYVVE